MPPNGVKARSVSCNNTFCPPNIRVLSASIRPVYAARRVSTSEFRIKDPEVYQLARQVADLTGESLTDAVRYALRDRLKKEQRMRPDPLFIEKLLEISDRCAALPVIDPRSDDELVGYDELGIPL